MQNRKRGQKVPDLESASDKKKNPNLAGTRPCSSATDGYKSRNALHAL